MNDFDMELDQDEESQLKSLLLWRTIEKIDEDTLELDTGIKLKIVPNEGCGGCSSGWYYLTELNDCPNAITDVSLVCRDKDDDEYGEDHTYIIFVFAENKRIKLAEIDGSDGNGYYGTGYRIEVTLPK